MEKALISVIIPVYNTAEFLDECIQSIVHQTYPDLQIVLVDDGSTDRSPKICDEWARRDPRICVIHKQNGGAAAARNTGLKIAKGKYIGFLDSDDYIAEDMYELLVNTMESTEKGIVDCGVSHVFQDGNISEGKKRVYGELDVAQALDAVFHMEVDTAVWCKLFDRSVFEELRFPEGETNEEFPLIVPSVIKAKGLVQIEACKYFYRHREGSVTSARLPNTKVLYKNLRLMEDQLKQYGIVRRSFGFFAAHYSYLHCLKLEKNYPILTPELKKNYKLYRAILWKQLFVYLFSSYSSVKNKVLYLLVLTKLLRPLYKIFGKQL